jgi:hypothetical protein
MNHEKFIEDEWAAMNGWHRNITPKVSPDDLLNPGPRMVAEYWKRAGGPTLRSEDIARLTGSLSRQDAALVEKTIEQLGDDLRSEQRCREGFEDVVHRKRRTRAEAELAHAIHGYPAKVTLDDLKNAVLAVKAAEIPATQRAAPGAALTTRLDTVEPEDVAWLWPRRIALGKLTLIAGDPGLGKSFVTLDIAARVSRGQPWPDAPGVPNPSGGVVLLNAEDGLADTIAPRLDAAGADRRRIVSLDGVAADTPSSTSSERGFNLRDLPALEQAIAEVSDCRLVVIDPITSYLGAVDSHKNAEVRGLLGPLAALAAKHNVAIVAVTHLNKSGNGPAIYRTMGSLAFAAAARAAWAAIKDKEDPRRRLFIPVKNNLSQDTRGLAYRIESPDGGRPCVAWQEGEVSITADDALADDRDGQRERTEREDCAEWLTVLLANGPIPAREVEREARDAGQAVATLRRAKAEIKVESRRSAFGGPWEWFLPKPAEDAHLPKMATEGAVSPSSEHLRDKPAAFDEIPPKALTSKGVSIYRERLCEGEHLREGGEPRASPPPPEPAIEVTPNVLQRWEEAASLAAPPISIRGGGG